MMLLNLRPHHLKGDEFPKVLSSNVPWQKYLWIMLMLFVAACGLPSEPTQTPTPMPGTGSIKGVVWHDECFNSDAEGAPQSGCIVSTTTGRFLANGVLEPDELGLPDVTVSLGEGPCPSGGKSTTTGADGTYTFTNLASGIYCVSMTEAILEPGTWTYPTVGELGIGSMTIALGTGETRDDVNFGWDYFDIPEKATPTPVPADVTPLPTCTDKATFIEDVTIPDDTRVDPGETFTKTWRLRNSGTCTWTPEYTLMLVSGYSLGASGAEPLKGVVPPGSSVDLSVEMQAPTSFGTYQGYWMILNPGDELFGIGEAGSSPFWVRIIVGPEPTPEITEWRGEYYDNRKLQGDPVLVRNDEEIDFNWKRESPADEIPNDDFSARWTRSVQFEGKIYRFYLRADDGFRFWVDDRMVFDEWEDSAAIEMSIDLAMTKGEHDLKVEYYEHTGNAEIQLWWKRLKNPSYPGWKAMYWFNRKLNSQWALVRSDDDIDFDWGSGSPALGIPSDNFSARWQRQIEFDPGIYRLSVVSDDGVRLFVDGVSVLDEWHDGGGGEIYTTDVTLVGSHEITVDYYEHAGNAKIEFWWEKVDELNNPPLAVDDAYRVEVNEILKLSAPGVLNNDSDPDGDPLKAVIVKTTENGTVTLNDNGAFEYAPDLDYIGTDSFTYRADDGNDLSNIGTVTLTVIPPNEPPVAVNDAYNVDEDTILNVPVAGVLSNDDDPEGDALTAVLVSSPDNGILSLNDDGSFEYTPDLDFNGVDTFTYQANDGTGHSSIATVTITINPINDSPQAVDDSASTSDTDTIDIDVLANDSGLGDGGLTISIETSPGEGTVEVIDDQIRYTPFGGYAGTDSFTYTVTDVDGESSTATVIVTLS